MEKQKTHAMKGNAVLLTFAAFMTITLTGCIGVKESAPAPAPAVSKTATPPEPEPKAVKGPVSFFVTSANPGKGADLGGLEGADAYCQSLATKAKLPGNAWKAYLSATASGTTAAVNARDRIGKGPWYNTRWSLVANSVNELHSGNRLDKEVSLDENGEEVMGRGDPSNLHDILTGSNPDGTASGTTVNTTCSNWTSSGSGSAIVGHHDRKGLNESDSAKSWNSSHLTKGCAPDSLKSTGWAGLVYCFATTP